MKQIFIRLLRERQGSAAIEFALIGPIFITMFMGVLQIGIGMQNYNAMRGISADVARYAVVNYQTANRLSTSQLEDYTRSVAASPPYGLTRGRLTATVSTAATQRVAGATEYSVALTYNVPSVLGIMGMQDIPLNYTRPIFVISE